MTTAWLLEWQKELLSKAAIQPQPVQVDIAAPLTPLLDRLKKLADTLTPAQRQQGLPLEFYRERLQGRQAGRKVHGGELGEALRKLGYTRKRTWGGSANGFRALWWPPS